jgi:RNA recognition motif-containing protein
MHSTILEGRHVVVHYARTHFNYKRASYPPTETLFIGSLPLEMTDRDLQDLFHDVKNLIDVRIPVDRRSGMPRGFAHAEFISTEAAMQAMEILAMKRPYGRKLGVSFAERKRVGMMKPRPEPVDKEQAKAEAEARRRDRARREAEAAEEAERALEEEIASEKEAKLEDETAVEEKKKKKKKKV